jgi:hypothetical protein
VKPSNNVDMTKPAGRRNKNGYAQLRLSVCGLSNFWQAHQIVYYLHYGTWPTQMLDHKDQDKQNNDPENLRLATSVLNQQNTPVQSNNKTGVKGVYRIGGVYRAQLWVQGRRHQKHFPTLEEAIAHRKYLEEKYHPFAPSQQTVA